MNERRLRRINRRYREGIRERLKQKQKSIGDAHETVDTPFSAGDVILETQTLTESLKQLFQGLGVKDKWLLGRTAIYQDALVNLAKDLELAQMPDYVRAGAFEEMVLLARSLTQVFTKKLQTSLRGWSEGLFNVEGYYITPNGETKRVVIQHRPEIGQSKFTGRKAYPTTQVLVKDILGQNTQGRAIADQDADLRIGFRLGLDRGRNIWTVSIDSGQRFTKELVVKGEDPKDWRIIRPLSQAINWAKLSPETFTSSDTDPNRYTYHYDDPNSQLSTDRETQTMFNVFNLHLGEIARNLS